MPREIEVHEDWRPFGLCFGTYDEVFFPDSYGGREAQAICNRCPVQVECLEYAVKTRPPYGVWGGMTRSIRIKFTAEVRRAEEPKVQAEDPFPDAAAEAS